MIDLKPKICNLCGGDVIFTSNSIIYGKEFGSGYCYCCIKCGAYVGTHEPYPDRAYGILANTEMREKKRVCHSMFDKMWTTKGERNLLYRRLAKQMEIPKHKCHFGYMDIPQLDEAILILKEWEAQND